MRNSEIYTSTKRFLNAIFLPFFVSHKGFIEVRQINSGKVSSEFFPSIDILMESFDNFKGNTYFGVGARIRKEGKKDAVKMLTCFWTDIDYGQEGHRKKNWYATAEEALAGIRRFPIPPSIIVYSGNGYHCYWLLDQAYEITNPEIVEKILKALIVNLGGDHGTHDLSRILRLPGTFNLKDSTNPKRADIVHFNEDRKYSYRIFEDLVEKTSIIEALTSETRKLVLNGQACSNLGSRSETDFRVICELLRLNTSDEQIKRVFQYYEIGNKYQEDGKRYLEHSIKNARQSINNNPESFFEKRNPKALLIAHKIISDNTLIFSGGSFFSYKNGVYKAVATEELKKQVIIFIGDSITRHKINEIIEFIQSFAYVPADEINSSDLINLKDGLFDFNNKSLTDHTPAIKSTTQINACYSPNATCILWLKSLNEIFLGDAESISLLQEFFGLCLTKITKFDKALILVGDGANGKSVVVYILGKLLGKDNYSAIPIEKLNNTHYLAGLFGKLANISIETPTNIEIYDSVFKAIVTGDEIQADHKFGKPFKFSPFCKLVIALNTLPRVADKTDGYFRRLLILRFPRQFSEKEQDKALKFKLEEELDGILFWALEGLKRLLVRGDFIRPKTMEEEILEYRIMNNSVLSFVQEECLISPEQEISKSVLYGAYQQWCGFNGLRPVSKKKVSQEIIRHYPTVGGQRSGTGRFWIGVGVKNSKANEDFDSDNINVLNL